MTTAARVLFRLTVVSLEWPFVKGQWLVCEHVFKVAPNVIKKTQINVLLAKLTKYSFSINCRYTWVLLRCNKPRFVVLVRSPSATFISQYRYSRPYLVVVLNNSVLGCKHQEQHKLLVKIIQRILVTALSELTIKNIDSSRTYRFYTMSHPHCAQVALNRGADCIVEVVVSPWVVKAIVKIEDSCTRAAAVLENYDLSSHEYP